MTNRPALVFASFGVSAICALFFSCTSSDDGAAPGGNDAGIDVTQPETSLVEAAAMGKLGAACSDDSQCGADGTICSKATSDDWFGPSGVAGGYCTKSCLEYAHGAGTVDPCVAIGGHCSGFKTSDTAYCLEGCTRGEKTSKCHGRSDVGCVGGIDRDDKFAAYDQCSPTCSQSSVCGAGRACDPGRRCVAAANVRKGDADGTACSVDAKDTCAGVCRKVTDAPGDGGTGPAYVCATDCVIGFSPDPCGPMAACLYALLPAVKGDKGRCQQLCDKASDCLDHVHQVVCDPSTIKDYGHGSCTIVGLAADADGGADGG